MNYPDEQRLGKMLDQVKGDVFRSKNAAFLGGVMCLLDFKWCDDGHEVTTAAVDGKTIFWAKKDFMKCSKDEKKWTLIHEVWHVARLHFLRGIGRLAKLWNKACDIRINNDMIYDGCQLPSNGMWLFDLSIEKEDARLSEEQIYDLLLKKQEQNQSLGGNEPSGDMLPMPGDENKQKQSLAEQVRIVINALTVAKEAMKGGQAGNIPGGVEEALKQFLAPVVPWRDELWMFMTDLVQEDYTWSRRNRRYPNIIMPGRDEIPDGLDNVVAFIDTSGSVTDQMVERFNSELKYIWETLHPKTLTVIQFDTKIHDTRKFNEGDEFKNIMVYGRGGTSMKCVHDWIEKNRPTAVLILSDFECAVMERPSYDVPCLFAVTPGNGILPDYGKIIQVPV